MTERDVLSRLERRIAVAGGVRPLAREWDLSASYLSDIRNGRKQPGEDVCFRLGVQPVKVYRPLRLLSSTDLAAIFGVHDRSVRNWWDSGRLPVFQYPGSRHRRTELESLKSFVMRHYEGETRDAILQRIDNHVRERASA